MDNSTTDITNRGLTRHLVFNLFHSPAAQLSKIISKSSRKLYWLDTLCIPVQSPRHRTKAISSMACIYAGSLNVLVLDLELPFPAASISVDHPLIVDMSELFS